MAEQKTSRKVLKTQMLIRRVLAELLGNKELKDITVQEIADNAKISRTTFYNYNTNVDDIYRQTEQVVLEDLKKIVQVFGMADERICSALFFCILRKIPKYSK